MNRAQRRNVAKSRNPRDLAALAEHYQQSGQTRKAEQTYREAIARDPQLVEAFNNLGMILQQRGSIAEATTQFVRARELRPSDARIVVNLARALAAQNQFRDAAVMFHQAVSLDPRFADARFGLALAAQGKIAEVYAHADVLARAETAPGFPHKSFGILLARIDCPGGARSCFETHLLHHPDDEDEIAMLLATVGDDLPERASDRQIDRIYAARADQWDRGAAGAAGYQGHRLVASALDELGTPHAGAVIDLGCGTGLVGELLRCRSDRLIGIDLSEPMLAQARRKKLYDELHQADLLGWLARQEAACDVIASAATLIHFGDLNAIFAAASRSLRPGGRFAFTLFPNDDDPDAIAVASLAGLAQAGCFRHGTVYVAQAAGACGFAVELMRRADHEYVNGAPIEGLVVALRKPLAD